MRGNISKFFIQARWSFHDKEQKIGIWDTWVVFACCIMKDDWWPAVTAILTINKNKSSSVTEKALGDLTQGLCLHGIMPERELSCPLSVNTILEWLPWLWLLKAAFLFEHYYPQRQKKCHWHGTWRVNLRSARARCRCLAKGMGFWETSVEVVR